jgi:hypothetical protein
MSRSLVGRVWHRLGKVYRHDLGPTERSALWAWTSFATTFGITRAVTHWIRSGHGPASGGMTVAGRHFHHYNIGIALLELVGAIAIRGEERDRRHPLTAVAYGSGTALIVDELALLIDLQDVYWSTDGRRSVDAAIGTIAAGGVTFAAIPFWRAAARELTRVRDNR